MGYKFTAMVSFLCACVCYLCKAFLFTKTVHHMTFIILVWRICVVCVVKKKKKMLGKTRKCCYIFPIHLMFMNCFQSIQFIDACSCLLHRLRQSVSVFIADVENIN